MSGQKSLAGYVNVQKFAYCPNPAHYRPPCLEPQSRLTRSPTYNSRECFPAAAGLTYTGAWALNGRVRASNKSSSPKFRSRGSKMRFSLAVAVALASLSVSGLAQQNNTFKVKPSHTEKAPRSSVPINKTGMGPASTSASANKDLKSLEHQTAQASAPIRPAGRRTPGKAPALRPAKTKSNPPINFNGSGGARHEGVAGQASQSSNPYKGRLKQKYAHQ